jgi:hypothetical protein
MFFNSLSKVIVSLVACTVLWASDGGSPGLAPATETDDLSAYTGIDALESGTVETPPEFSWQQRPATDEKTARRLHFIFTHEYVTAPDTAQRFVDPWDTDKFNERVGKSPSVERLRDWLGAALENPPHRCPPSLAEFNLILCAVRAGRISVERDTVFVTSERYPLDFLQTNHALRFVPPIPEDGGEGGGIGDCG